MNILQNSALAQDAVQDAMLALWLSTKEIPDGAEVRAWILRLVASKSLNLRRTRKRASTREEHVGMERNRTANAVTEELERTETIAALRSQIEGLPDMERQLLACYYGAKMSHRKIGELLGISHPTVSTKIENALSQLRTGLTRAGVAAILPLSPEYLFEATMTGHPCPAGMTARLMETIKRAGSARHVSRTLLRPAARGRWLFIVAGAAALTAAAVGFVREFNPPGPTATSNPAKSATVSVSPAAPVSPVPAPLDRTWDFALGSAADLKLLGGTWSWRKLAGGAGVMDVPADPAAVVLLPDRTQQNLVIDIFMDGAGRTGATCHNTRWIENYTLLPHREFRIIKSVAPGTLRSRIYVIGRHIVSFEGDDVTSIVEYERPSDELCFILENISVFKIELKSIKPEEMPPSLQDIEGLKRSMGVEPIKGKNSGINLAPAK